MPKRRTITDYKQYHREWYVKNRKKVLLASSKRRATRKGLPFSLTDEWYDTAYGDGICPVLGLPYELEKTSEGPNTNPLAPSIDRLIPSLGYTPENCRIISYWANVSRSDWPEDIHYEYMALALKRRFK